MLVKMNVTNRNESFTVNSITGEVTGQTYAAKEFLKDNFNAKWNKEAKQWTVDVKKFNDELSKYADYYKKYIVDVTETAEDKVSEDAEVEEVTESVEVAESVEAVKTAIQPTRTIVSEKLVNGNDGFYNRVTYSDGKIEYHFVG